MSEYALNFGANAGVMTGQAVVTLPEDWKKFSDKDMQNMGRAMKMAAPAIVKAAFGGPYCLAVAAGSYVAGAGIQTWDRLDAEKRAYAANKETAPSGIKHTVGTFIKQLSPVA